jgi:hypothetical protein
MKKTAFIGIIFVNFVIHVLFKIKSKFNWFTIGLTISNYALDSRVIIAFEFFEVGNFYAYTNVFHI